MNTDNYGANPAVYWLRTNPFVTITKGIVQSKFCRLSALYISVPIRTYPYITIVPPCMAELECKKSGAVAKLDVLRSAPFFIPAENVLLPYPRKFFQFSSVQRWKISLRSGAFSAKGNFAMAASAPIFSIYGLSRFAQCSGSSGA